MDRQGRIADSELASLYYKVPAALAQSGDLAGALLSLEWISRTFLTRTGALAIPGDQAPARTYDRAWLVWGAATCGRYDIAFPLAEEIRRSHNSSTGGFWETLEEGGQGRHHAMTAGMAGLAMLSVRHLSEARASADFLRALLRRQPRPDERFLMAVRATSTGDQEFLSETGPSDYVDTRGHKQRPARLGPAQILFIRLYRLLRDPRYLEAAHRYTAIFLDGPPGIYDCIESHKFLWGIEELHQVAPDTRLRQAADRIVAYILEHQHPDGQWWGDAIGGGLSDQPLELRLNTTCNVLVGLAAHLQLAHADTTTG